MITDYSKENLTRLLEEGEYWELGYDCESIVMLACDIGPGFLDFVLDFLKKKGQNPVAHCYRCDQDGYSAVRCYFDKPGYREVFVKYGIKSKDERRMPAPWSNVYELNVERKMIAEMEKTARKWHAGQFRKDGETPYAEHPAKVAAMVSGWGFEPECDGWAVAVAWAHDLLEETAPEMREDVEREIRASAGGYLNEGEKVLDAVKLLTRNPGKFALKPEYIAHVAKEASFPVLAVKIADRLCNTLDFLALPGAGIGKAADYFALGEPLFAALDRHDDRRKQRILDSIEDVKSRLCRGEGQSEGIKQYGR